MAKELAMVEKKEKKDYNGFEIEFQVKDGQVYANATAMCQPFGKRINDWKNLPETDRYIDVVTRKSGIAKNQLVVSKKGGKGQGTWIHEKMILKLAQWLDTEFEYQCDEWIAETGNEFYDQLNGMEF